MNCADQTAAEVDNEVMSILKECYGEALGLLRENREVMDKIADHLIVKETITGKEFMQIYREAKGLPEPEEKPKEDKVSLEKPTVEATSEPQQQNDVSSVYTGQPKDSGADTNIYGNLDNTNRDNNNSDNTNSDNTNNDSNNNNDSGNNGANNPSDGREYSQFGSAWDQNVNGHR
jgi:cell division protease FtsH